MTLTTNKLIPSLLLLCILFTAGCIVVKNPTVKDEPSIISISPKPDIKMSDILVRSQKGDMIAFLPEGWFFIDVKEKVSPEVFAVAVNPEYTLSCVFTSIHKNEKIDTLYKNNGLLGVAGHSMEIRRWKTADDVKQVGNYTTLQMGSMSFMKYETTTSSGSLTTMTSVFISSLNQYYEMSLIPMYITGKTAPTKQEMTKIFNSILATIQY